MAREKNVSVRFSAVGGETVKAEMRGIGMAGKKAMQDIAGSTAPASASMDEVSMAAARARDQLESIAARAASAAASMRSAGAATTPMVDQINRLTGITPAIGQTTAEFLRQGQALDDLRAKYNPVFAVIRQYRNELSELRDAHIQGALSVDEFAAAKGRARQAALASIAAYKGSATQMAQMSRASRGATLRMQQMFFQVNDIGVSLAGGMNPFVVMAQQGTQIAQIYGFGNGGVTGIFRDLGGLIGKLPGYLKLGGIAIGVAAAAVAGLQHEINEVSNVTVTFGDTALAVWQVFRDGIWRLIKPAVDVIATWFSNVWDKVVTGIKWAGNMLINGMRIAVDGIGTAISVIPDLFLAAFNQALSNVMTKMHDMVWYVAQAINGIAQTMNEVFGTEFGTDALGGIITQLSDASGTAFQNAQGARDRISGAWDGFNDRADETFASDPMGRLFNAISGRAQQNARDRLAAEDKGGAGGGASEQTSAVDKLIQSLQQELSVLRETDPIKKKMLEYSEQLAGATEGERQAVLGLVQALDAAKYGWEAVGRTLSDYAQEASRIGDDIGNALVTAFNNAEDAIGEFVKTGKLSFSDLVTSLLVDLAKLGARKFILGPIANALSGALGGLGGGFGNFMLPSVYHAGGIVGGPAPTRMVPAMAFAGAPRMHSGGWAGLKSDEVPAILQRGERVLSRREARDYGGGGVTVNINARDAESFRQSRTQIAADIARAVSAGRRGM